MTFPRYCPSTDALIGEGRQVLDHFGAWGTREWAFAKLDQVARGTLDPEVSLIVVDSSGREVARPLPEPEPLYQEPGAGFYGDDIPF